MEVKVVNIDSIKVIRPATRGRFAQRKLEYENALTKVRDGKAVLFDINGSSARGVQLRVSRAAKRLGMQGVYEIGKCSYEGKEYIYAKPAS